MPVSPAEMKALERVFGMESGYVLDLTNDGFRSLVIHGTGIDPYDEQRHSEYAGLSKAKIVRLFLEKERPELSGRLIKELFQFAQAYPTADTDPPTNAELEIIDQLILRLLSSTETSMVREKVPRVFETMSETYRVTGPPLGQGGVGVVFEVVDSSGNAFALKIISETVVSTEKVKRFRNELKFLSRSRHKHLVAVVDEGFVAKGDRKIPFYVMPKYEQTLRDLIEQGLPAKKILGYFSDLLSGVDFLHSKRIQHRDLKPENVLYDSKSDCLVVADLGAAHFAEEELHTLVETKPGARLANFQYAAPEQRVRDKSNEVSHLADLFALGAILNEMFTRSIPHGEDYPKIGEAHPDFAHLDPIVARLLKNRPEQRFQSISDLRSQLPNPPVSSASDGLNTVGEPDSAEKSEFELSLREIDRLYGEQAFAQQKLQYFRSEDAANAVRTMFATMLDEAVKRHEILARKDGTFEIEKHDARTAFAVKGHGCSITFAMETTHISSGREYRLFAKRWSGRFTFNPNVVYFDDEWKPKVVETVEYTADLNSSHQVCWLNPKSGEQYPPGKLVDSALAWLVTESVKHQRKN